MHSSESCCAEQGIEFVERAPAALARVSVNPQVSRDPLQPLNPSGLEFGLAVGRDDD